MGVYFIGVDVGTARYLFQLSCFVLASVLSVLVLEQAFSTMEAN